MNDTAIPARPSPVITYGSFLFKRRNAVFPIVLLALFLAFRPQGDCAMLPWIGLGVTALGQVLRGTVIGLAYIKRGGLNKKVYAETLVTTGFFTMCRNPLYVGNVLILGGLLLIHGNPWVLLIGSVFFLTAYQAIIATEENYLRNKFGDEYRDYCARVPRWFIRFGRAGQALAGMKFNWRKMIYKDYSTLASWSAQALLLFAYREYTLAGTKPVTLLLAIPAVGVIALGIRTVKKKFPL